MADLNDPSLIYEDFDQYLDGLHKPGGVGEKDGGIRPEEGKQIRQWINSTVNPEQTKRMIQNIRFVEERVPGLGEIDVDQWYYVRPAVASHLFDVDDPDINEDNFYALVQGKRQDEKNQLDLQKKLFHQATDSALMGGDPAQEFSKWLEFRRTDPVPGYQPEQEARYREIFLNRFKETQEALGPYREQVLGFLKEVGEDDKNVDATKIGGFIDILKDLEPEQQDAALSVVGSFQQVAKDRNIAEKVRDSLLRAIGTGLDKRASKRLDISAASVIEAYESGDQESLKLALIREKTLNEFSEKITGVDKVKNYEELYQAAIEARKVTATERKVQNWLNNKYDPLKTGSMVWQGLIDIAGSVPLIAEGLVTGYVHPLLGFATVANALSEGHYDNMMLENPRANPMNIARAANTMGAVEAVPETLSNMLILGKLPTFNAAMGRIQARLGGGLRGGAAAVAGTGGAAVATEWTEEYVQNITSDVIQSIYASLDEDVPGVDLRETVRRLNPAAEENLRTFFAVLPFAIIGGAAGGVNFANKQFINNQINLPFLERFDIVGEEAFEIINEPNVDKRIEMVFQRINKVPIQEIDNAVSEIQESPTTPTVQVQNGEYAVQYPGESVSVKYPSKEAAITAQREWVEQNAMEQSRGVLDEVAQKRGFPIGPVYHGTSTNVSEFSGEGERGNTFFFTRDENIAREYAEGVARRAGGEPRVIKAYLRGNVKNVSHMEEINVGDVYAPGIASLRGNIGSDVVFVAEKDGVFHSELVVGDRSQILTEDEVGLAQSAGRRAAEERKIIKEAVESAELAPAPPGKERSSVDVRPEAPELSTRGGQDAPGASAREAWRISRRGQRLIKGELVASEGVVEQFDESTFAYAPLKIDATKKEMAMHAREIGPVAAYGEFMDPPNWMSPAQRHIYGQEIKKMIQKGIMDMRMENLVLARQREDLMQLQDLEADINEELVWQTHEWGQGLRVSQEDLPPGDRIIKDITEVSVGAERDVNGKKVDNQTRKRLKRKMKKELGTSSEEAATELSKIEDEVQAEIDSEIEAELDKASQSLIERLAKEFSDTPTWAESKEARETIFKLWRRHVKEPMDTFLGKAMDLGATERQAEQLDQLAVEERRRREAVLRNREVESGIATADRLIELLATEYSDTLSWVKKESAKESLKALWRRHVRGEVDNFIDEAENKGATAQQAKMLDTLAMEERRRIGAAIRARAEFKRQHKIEKFFDKLGKVPKKGSKSSDQFSKLVKSVADAIELRILDADRFRLAFAQAYNLTGLTQKDIDHIIELSKKINELGENQGRLRVDYERELHAYIAKRVDIPAADLITSYWYANILSSTNTQAVNIWGNATHLFTSWLRSSIAAAIKGDFRSGGTQLRAGMLAAATVGINEARAAFRGAPSIKGLDRKYDYRTNSLQHLTPSNKARFREQLADQYHDLISGKGGKIRNIISLLRVVFSGLQAGDAFFYRTSYEMRIAAAASRVASKKAKSSEEYSRILHEEMHNTREEINDAMAQSRSEWAEAGRSPTETDVVLRAYEIIDAKRDMVMRVEADAWAKYVTYTNAPDGGLGIIAKQFSAARSQFKDPWLGFEWLRPFVPFVNIIANVGSSSIAWSGVGLVRAAANRPHIFSDSDYQWENQRIEDAVSGILGGVGLAVLWGMASQFLDDDDPEIAIYASGPRNPADKEVFYQSKKKPWSVHVKAFGQKWNLSFNETPLVVPLSIIGALHDFQRETKSKDLDIPDRVWYALSASIAAFQNTGFLSSLREVFQFAENPKSIRNFTANTTGGLIPTRGFLRDIERVVWGDIPDRDYNWQGIWLSGLPFSEVMGVEERLNWFGEEIHREMASRVPGVSRVLTSGINDPDWDFMADKGLRPRWVTVTLTPSNANSREKRLADKVKELRHPEEEIGRYASNTFSQAEHRVLVQRAGPRIREVIRELRLNRADEDTQVLQEAIDKDVVEIINQEKVKMLKEIADAWRSEQE